MYKVGRCFFEPIKCLKFLMVLLWTRIINHLNVLYSEEWLTGMLLCLKSSGECTC